MGLPQGSVRLIEAMDPITPDNWAKARRTLKMFFQGVHTPWVTKEKGTTEGNIDNNDNDQEVMWLLYSKLAPEYQYLGEGVTCAQDLWIACTGTFEASNMTTRMNARRDFVRTIHDPSKPIALYISAIEEAVTRLERLGAKPGPSEIADTLLMNLDDSLSATRITILTAEKEPTLEAIKAQIRNAGPSVPLKEIKKEEEDDDELSPLAAHTARTRSEPPRSRASRGTGTSGSRRAPGTSGSHKFHWCSPTSNDQCRRCGTPGHISDRCIHDMPSNVKDWVLAGPPGKSDRASAAFASDSSDGEAAGHLAYGPFASLVDSDTDSEPELKNYFVATVKA
ncbi:CCHC-type domain-containing protein [Mycena sanguinolenta]|uniref:CCHC-type domain-containing protein n=1 Tax=Mycena sanguinolenta TaxID=230812 RepID=A0A8H6XWP1_9AGAR|nr:CCHC-type domain-containing protein [Mycena sanguinolenta]